MLLGRADIWARNWFVFRGPKGQPCMSTPQGLKHLVRARDHLRTTKKAPRGDDPEALKEYVRLLKLGDLVPPDVLAMYTPEDSSVAENPPLCQNGC